MSLGSRNLRWVALAALLLPTLAACQQPEVVVGKPARLVRVVTVASQDYAQTATLTGEVQALSRIDLAFRLTGQITEIDVEVGDHVTASQVLARIDAWLAGHRKRHDASGPGIRRAVEFDHP